jgi:hypothetical protein
MYINDFIIQIRNSGHAKFRMYQTQTVISKIKTQSLQLGALQRSENTTELAAL